MKSDLINKVPKTKGNLIPNANIAGSSWFKVGGNAELLFQPEDEDDLFNFLKNLDDKIDIFVMGGASNILIRDGGIPGVTIKLNKLYNQVIIKNDKIIVGASVKNMFLANYAKKEQLTGCEFLSGIPGTIGGAVRMNSGSYGKCIADILDKIEVMDGVKGIYEISKKKLNMKYRKIFFPKKAIILNAVFKTSIKSKNAIEKTINLIKSKRIDSQPVKSLTGGSTFKNPVGMKAWKLIDKAGCRGMSIGGAKISEIHTNFIVNYNNASACDIENLGEEVRNKVYNKLGINLEWEIIRVGKTIKEF